MTDNSILPHVAIHRIGEVRDKRATDSNVYVRRALGKNAEQSFLVSKSRNKAGAKSGPLVVIPINRREDMIMSGGCINQAHHLRRRA